MSQFTQIPVEWLFGIITALISVMYVDLKRAVSNNTKAGLKRDFVLVKICEKLGIKFDPNER